ncbi:GNVR domain-containing protein [Photobacterium galatheae]|uniref:GumC family protein n=1 Tax=Photobacterium galatheae TaxID=1654360 RepID=UPI00055BB313|nr:chain-length determining protein [Photobacterium galatheae]
MMRLSHRFLIILEAAWRRRYLIVLPILILPVFGGIIGTFSPKSYRSHTSMLIQETSKMNPFLEDLAVSAMLKDRMDALKTLLHSRHILGAVARDRGLIHDHTSDAEADAVIARLSAGLSVSMMGKDLIRIDYRSGAREGMKETLDIVSRHFIEQVLAPERSSMKDSSYFLSEHIQYRREELEKAEQALASYKSEHITELPELQVSTMTQLGQLKQRLAEKDSELAGAVRSLGGLDQQLSRTNPVIGRIEEQIIKTRSEITLLRARYTDQHSAVQGSLRELRRLEDERQKVLSATPTPVNPEQLWDIASHNTVSDNGHTQPLLISQLEQLQLARSKVDALQEETASLKNMVHELEAKAHAFGNKEQELKRLERDLAVKSQLYDELLKRYEMARLTSSLGIFEQDKRIKVIDQPFTPSRPSNLSVIVFILSGMVGGIFIGSGAALMLELTDTSVRRKDRLSSLTGVPVLTRLPPQPQTAMTLDLGASIEERRTENSIPSP